MLSFSKTAFVAACMPCTYSGNLATADRQLKSTDREFPESKKIFCALCNTCNAARKGSHASRVPDPRGDAWDWQLALQGEIVWKGKPYLFVLPILHGH